MLDGSGNKREIPKKLKLFGVAVVAVVVVAFGVVTLIDSLMVSRDDTGSTATVKGNVNNTTAFDGVDINTADPDAVKQYCEDSKTQSQLNNGSTLVDMCVLESVAKEWLPRMTDIEIAKMLDNDPGCFDTGMDADGFNCFTFFDESGCNRDGLDAEGGACTPVGRLAAVETPVENLLALDPAKICDIVSGCEDEKAFDQRGFNKYGCNRQGRRDDGTMCPEEFITRIYGDDERDQLGFDKQGFNENNCDLQGLRADGTQCPISLVTRVYDRNNKDQFGFGQDGYNESNCDVKGLDRQGKVCRVENITRLYDPSTGFDQFGISKDGYNVNDCDLAGFDRSGALCSADDITRIYGKDGFDQFGLRENGRNEFNCDLAGKKPDGSLCKESELTRLHSPLTGQDQFGFFKNGRNKHDCDKKGVKPDGKQCSADERSARIDPETGLDEHGFNGLGFNNKNCDINGLRADGSICPLEDITRIYTNGRDQFGLDEAGFNDKNCNTKGFDRAGKQCDMEDTPKIYGLDIESVDQFGFKRDGFNKFDCDINGLDRAGNVCPIDNITRVYGADNLDQFGLDLEGYDPTTGCNLSGFKKDGSRCTYDEIPKITGENGFNQLGVNSDGRNVHGCDLNGKKANGEICADNEKVVWYDDQNFNVKHQDPNGFGRLGFGDDDYNKHGCDINGLNITGKICPIEHITHVFDPETGLDQFGLDPQGYNSFDCNLQGLNRAGEQCEAMNIPRLFDKDFKDQFGISINDLPQAIWGNNDVVSPDNLVPMLNANGEQMLLDGEAVYIDDNGFLRDDEGNLLLGDDGKPLTLDQDGKIIDSQGNTIKPSRFTNIAGEKASGTFKKPMVSSSSPMLNAKGEQMLLDGEAVFVDKKGFLRDAQGKLILGDDGEPLRLDVNGNVIDSKGNKVKAERFTNVAGEKASGSFKKASASTSVPMLNAKGEQMLLNGEAIFVDKKGFLRDAQGKLILGDDGEPLRLDANGNVIDSKGNKVKAERFTNIAGEKASGSFKKASASTSVPMLNAKGEQMLLNGEAIFVDKKGFLRDAQGKLILGDDGEPLRLDANGNVIDSKGNKVKAERFTNIAGEKASGSFKKASASTSVPMLNAKGEQMLLNGEAIFVDKKGFLRDAQGKLILGDDGEPLRLDANGNVIDSKGNKVKAERFTNIAGEKASGSFKKASVSTSVPMLNAKGEQMLLNGEAIFVDKKGFLRDAQGKLILGDDGEPLRLDANGNVIDSKGNKVKAERFTNIAGEKASGSFKKASVSTSVPMLNTKGEQMYLDGKPVFIGEDGLLRNAQGQLVLGDDGEPLRLDANGNVIDSKGNKVKAERFTNIAGEKATGSFQKAGLSDLTAMTGENGEQIFFDGKPVFVSEDGFLRDSEGNMLLGENGKPLRLDEEGNVIDSDGNVVAADRFTNIDGEKATGTFKKTDPSNLTAMTGENGEQIFFDGKPVFVSEDGFLRDSEGNMLLGENGKPLRLDEEGNVIDSDGNVVAADRFTNIDGEKATGTFKKTDPSNLTAMTGENGEQIFFDGKPAFVSEDGFLRDSEGNMLLGENGKPLRLDEEGNVINSDGNVVAADRFTNIDGEKATGTFLKSNAGSLVAMVTADGKPLYHNGEEVFVGEDGFLRDGEGNKILGVDGKPLRLNESGQVVDSQGNAVPPGAFTTVDGKKATGTFKKMPPNASIQENRALLAGLSAETIASLSLDKDGFNKKGCGLNGLRRDGTVCQLIDMPRIFDEESGLDQFGFGLGGYNLYGCDFEGKNRDGAACDLDKITRIVGADGFDQFNVNGAGLNRSGMASDGKNIFGCDATSTNPECAGRQTPRLYDEAKIDQFNKAKNGADRLGLIDGYNEKGCRLDGLNREGEHCALADIPRKFDGEGYDQFGMRRNGRNRFGCDVQGKKLNGELCSLEQTPRIFAQGGRDQFGLDDNGRNGFGCDLAGFKESGERCLAEEITRIYSNSELDQLGFGQDGYNINNCDIDGKDRTGDACELSDVTRVFNPVTGLDQFNFGQDGYNENDCDINGLNRTGELCKVEDVTRYYDENGVDQLGFLDDGFNAKNCDFYGYDRQGKLCAAEDITRVYDKDGVDQFGISKATSFNALGCDLAGKNRFGKVCKAKNKVKFVKRDGTDQFNMIDGVNDRGCSLAGLDKDGNRCALEDITRVVGEDGFDQLGLGTGNRNKFGCDINGLDESGKPCTSDELSHFFNLSGKDQFGLSAGGFNESGCNLLGLDSEGNLCKIEDSPAIMGDDGYSQLGFDVSYYDRQGYDQQNLDKNGCDPFNKDKAGKQCDKYQNLALTTDDGVYMESRKKLLIAWMNNKKAPKVTTIGAGSYDPKDDELIQTTPLVINNRATSTGFAATSANGNAEKEGNGFIEIPMGLALMVRVETPVNSDYTNDVYGTIMGSELDGARVKGIVEVPYLDNPVMPRDKFRYVFNTIIYKRRTYPIDAISLNLSNDSGMVAADDIDYHRIQRYGGLLVAAAVQSLDATFLDSQAEKDAATQAKVIAQATQNTLLYGNNTRELTKERLKTGTEHISSLAQEQFFRRPTITAKPGQHVIIFREEVDNDALPVVLTELRY